MSGTFFVGGQINQMRIFTAAPSLPVAASGFDSSDKGWQVSRDGVTETPTYLSSGGNPGGQISTRLDTGNRVVWLAPAAAALFPVAEIRAQKVRFCRFSAAMPLAPDVAEAKR